MPEVYYTLCLKKSKETVFLGKSLSCKNGQIEKKIGKKDFFLKIHGFSKLYKIINKVKIHEGHYKLFLEKSGLPVTVNLDTIHVYFEANINLVEKINGKNKKKRERRYRHPHLGRKKMYSSKNF